MKKLFIMVVIVLVVGLIVSSAIAFSFGDWFEDDEVQKSDVEKNSGKKALAGQAVSQEVAMVKPPGPAINTDSFKPTDEFLKQLKYSQWGIEISPSQNTGSKRTNYVMAFGFEGDQAVITLTYRDATFRVINDGKEYFPYMVYLKFKDIKKAVATYDLLKEVKKLQKSESYHILGVTNTCSDSTVNSGGNWRECTINIAPNSKDQLKIWVYE